MENNDAKQMLRREGTYHAVGPHFEIRRRGFHDLEYREADHSLTIEVDSELPTILYTSTIKQWQPPFSETLIDYSKKREIVKNLVHALDFLGIDYVLDEPELLREQE